MIQKGNLNNWKDGIKDGLPICFGYFAVSFSFGMIARQMGLTTWQAVIMSVTNVTSAGQFAGVTMINAGGSYIEMALTQLIINLRYCLMSCSLSQKLSSRTGIVHRLLVSYGVTDEIFGVSACREGILSPFYSYGLIIVSVAGWTGGTLIGVVCGQILPDCLINALGIALYGMFIAIIIPPARKNKVVAGVVLSAMAFSLLFAIIPFLKEVSSGFKIIIVTVLVAAIAALVFPISGEEAEE